MTEKSSCPKEILLFEYFSRVPYSYLKETEISIFFLMFKEIPVFLVLTTTLNWITIFLEKISVLIYKCLFSTKIKKFLSLKQYTMKSRPFHLLSLLIFQQFSSFNYSTLMNFFAYFQVWFSQNINLSCLFIGACELINTFNLYKIVNNYQVNIDFLSNFFSLF